MPYNPTLKSSESDETKSEDQGEASSDGEAEIPAVSQPTVKIDDDSENESVDELADEIKDRGVKKQENPKVKGEGDVVTKLMARSDEYDDDSEEEEEDAYVVEAIGAHKWEKKTLKYFIKWQGYPESDNTWEPEQNLLPGAREILAEYHRDHPDLLATVPKKRKSTQALRAEANIPVSKDQQRASKKARWMRDDSGDDTPSPNSATPIERWLPSAKTWDPEVDEIETMHKDSTGKLWVMIRWKNGKRSKVGMEMIYKHCSTPVLKFFERHLRFS